MTRSSLSDGSARLQTKTFDSRPRRNGNMPHVEAHRPDFGGAISSNRIRFIVRGVGQATIRRNRRRSAVRNRTHLDFTIWEATSVNGWRIAGTAITRTHQLMGRLRSEEHTSELQSQFHL